MSSKRISEDAPKSEGQCVLESLKKLKSSEAVEEVLPSSSASSKIQYVKDGPLLRVEPYWFDYCSWAKGRWFNIPLTSVFQKEFRDRPASYYKHACSVGLIRVNDSRIGGDYKIKQGDRIQHRIHRHEPPVLSEPEPEILHLGDGLMVVCKPPSIPMHPSGRYRHNTLTSILLHRHPQLFPTGHISCVNRLDRLVSGIVIISRSKEKADELRRAMQGMKFRKYYLARVKGSFEVNFDGLGYAEKGCDSCLIDCKAPLMIIEHKLGLSCVADSSVYPSSKPSHTRFIKLSYDPASDMSTILCEPVTGRTHQIRLHLQYLGYPIHNDPLYNNPFWKKLLLTQDHDGHDHPEESSIYAKKDWLDRVKEMAQELSKSPAIFPQDEELPLDYSFEMCPDCENPYADPDPATLRIDLHAYKYSGPMGTFSTALPDWIKVDNVILKGAEECFDKSAAFTDESVENDSLDYQE